MAELRFPLRSGPYLVVNGGTNTPLSSHARTLARPTPRQRLYWARATLWTSSQSTASA